MSKELVLVSDIHGNYPALKEVRKREGISATYLVLGDIHGLLAWPAEVMSLIEEMDPDATLSGNHDRSIFNHGEGHVNNDALSRFELEHTLEELTEEEQTTMRELPVFKVLEGSPRICATHAMPWPEQASGYEAGNAGVPKGSVPHVASIVADDYDYVFHGHTHEQYDLDCARFGHDVHFVNPGSIGYDGTYSTVDTATGEVEHKSVEYDHDALKDHVQSLLPEGAPHTGEWYDS